METNNEQEAFAFAECVRQQATRLVSLSLAGNNKEAAAGAHAIVLQAVAQKRRLQGLPVNDDTDEETGNGTDYDLHDFNRQYGSEGDTNPDSDR